MHITVDGGGIKPDFYVQLELIDGPKMTEKFRETAAGLRSEGATWFRFSWWTEHDIAVVEGWKERPLVEAPTELLLTGRSLHSHEPW